MIDTTDGPMRVVAQHETGFVAPGVTPASSRTGELCTTPCVVDLPVGRYQLFLFGGSSTREGGDTDVLVVEEGLNVYRRSPGKYVTPSPTDQIAPIILTVLGVQFLVFGPLVALPEDDGGAGEPFAGGVMMVGGLGMGIGGGVWAYRAARAEQQDGATTTWRQPLPTQQGGQQ